MWELINSFLNIQEQTFSRFCKAHLGHAIAFTLQKIVGSANPNETCQRIFNLLSPSPSLHPSLHQFWGNMFKHEISQIHQLRSFQSFKISLKISVLQETCNGSKIWLVEMIFPTKILFPNEIKIKILLSLIFSMIFPNKILLGNEQFVHNSTWWSADCREFLVQHFELAPGWNLVLYPLYSFGDKIYRHLENKVSLQKINENIGF
jgi:hypothetical protein